MFDRLLTRLSPTAEPDFTPFFALLQSLSTSMSACYSRIALCVGGPLVSHVVDLTFSGQTEVVGLLVRLWAMPLPDREMRYHWLTFARQYTNSKSLPHHESCSVHCDHLICCPPRGALRR
ncbi:hypothetical protein BDR03DRAFT_362726 [Suillus americanus]|nr:hypothetical protein BDR03DRAFT_362726 [Suillus americanus]